MLIHEGGDNKPNREVKFRELGEIPTCDSKTFLSHGSDPPKAGRKPEEPTETPHST